MLFYMNFIRLVLNPLKIFFKVINLLKKPDGIKKIFKKTRKFKGKLFDMLKYYFRSDKRLTFQFCIFFF